jgi:hypothetical protein
MYLVDSVRPPRLHTVELSLKADSLGTAFADAITRVVDLPPTKLVSEEDVKNKVVLPILRALGYDEADFNYEGKTGRGYVDIVVELFPTPIIVEAKSPRKKLENYLEQLETYIFHKHRRSQATIAILTDGELFHVYGVTEALFKGSLQSFLIFSFSRKLLCTPNVTSLLIDLIGKENNQKGAIADAIALYRKNRHDRLGSIDTELERLITERQRLDSRIEEVRTERVLICGPNVRDRVDEKIILPVGNLRKFPAIPHILRLLQEKNARSRASAVGRKWLDENLVNKAGGVSNHQAVSFGLIELKDKGQIDYEGSPKKVWLKS